MDLGEARARLRAVASSRLRCHRRWRAHRAAGRPRAHRSGTGSPANGPAARGLRPGGGSGAQSHPRPHRRRDPNRSRGLPRGRSRPGQAPASHRGYRGASRQPPRGAWLAERAGKYVSPGGRWWPAGGALLGAGLVDRYYWIQAPLWLGEGGVPALAGLPTRGLDQADRWRVVERRALGDDTLLVLDRG